VALVGPALSGGEATSVSSSPVEPKLVEVRRGDTLASLAAARGVSVARLVALNPNLGFPDLKPGHVRVR
jgi:hypothetical protein